MTVPTMMGRADAAPAVSNRRLLVILTCLSALAPFSTDMYLSGFNAIAASYHATIGQVESTLSFFFLGLAIGQAIYGPLADHFGRRIPLLCGLALFTAASALCLVAPSIHVLTALRLVQAIGGSAGMVIGRAIVRDLFDERGSARFLSLLVCVSILAPILSPAAGAWIIATLGWRTVFVFVTFFGCLCLAMAALGLKETGLRETHPPSGRIQQRPAALLAGYARLLGRRSFIVPTASGAMVQACIFCFITGSSTVFIGIFGVSRQHFGYLFGLVAVSIIVTANINRHLLRKHPTGRILAGGILLNVAAGLSLVAIAALGGLVWMVIGLFCTIGTIGFVETNAVALAMSGAAGDAGRASALIGVSQFACAMVASSCLSLLPHDTAYSMTGMMAACGCGGALLYFTMRRDTKPKERPRVSAS